jgi:hypothetical protein
MTTSEKILLGIALWGVCCVGMMTAVLVGVKHDLAAICQGQCEFGDKDCVKHCTERGICPTTGAKLN